MHVNVPPIKCQGIKTKLVPWIAKVCEDLDISTWIEPFCGSGVVAFNMRPSKAILCDTNPHLIDFYKSIKEKKITYQGVECFLFEEGNKLRTEGESYYYEVRSRFNEEHNPLDFLFLNRSCFNGMIRYNRKGKFNVPFCKKPERFAKAYITKIKNQVHYIQQAIELNDFEFKCQPFQKTISEADQNALIYCDPPYIDRHTDYFNGWGAIDEQLLYDNLSNFKGKFILSTWEKNEFRENTFVKELWGEFGILTREHFYFLGGKEKNRNPMIEALIFNFPIIKNIEIKKEKPAIQMTLFNN